MLVYLCLAKDNVAIAVLRLVNLRVWNYEEVLYNVSVFHTLENKVYITFFGLRRVTRVIPGTFFSPKLSSAFRALRSDRDWILSSAAAEVGSSPWPWS